MTTNQEFAKKLQAAIKAKIHELGAEADNDLAEYVMLLSANKKDKSKMKSELRVFLGKNTGCFVDWLFAALERIQKTLDQLKQAEKSGIKPEKAPELKDDKRQDKSIRADHHTKKEKSLKEERRYRHRSSSIDKKHHRESSKRSHKSPVIEKNRKQIVDKSTKRSRWDDVSKSEKQSKRSPRRNSPKYSRSPRHTKHDKAKEETRIRKRRSTNYEEEESKKISESEEEPPAKIELKQEHKNKSPDRQSKRPKISAPSSSLKSAHHSRLVVETRSSVELSYSEDTHRSSDHENLKSKDTYDERLTDDSTPTPLTNAWDGRITIDEESSDEDAEAQIDSLLDGLDQLIDTIPETSILSGSKMSAHVTQKGHPSPVQTTSTNNPQEPNISVIESRQIKKIPEKCRFWPGCDKNTNCQYIHPTEVCVVFPSCPFGDRCLNIHPLCKFNKKCKKPRCPFTHDLKGVATVVPYPHDVSAAIAQQKTDLSDATLLHPAQTPQISTTISCRFGGRCAVVDCKFTHPPPCRFGLRCQNPKCAFSHRKPNLKKFQWVNNSNPS